MKLIIRRKIKNRFTRKRYLINIPKSGIFEVSVMRRVALLFLLLIFLLPSCSKKSGTTVTVVKPKYHHRFFDRKKDRHLSRVKRVKVRN